MSNAIATPPKTETALATVLGEAAKALLTGTTDTGATKEGFSSVPYVGYYGAKALPETRAACEDAGVKVGQFFLNHVTPIKVDPFGLHWLSVGTLYTRRDQKMNIISTVLENNDENFKAGYREHLFGVVAVRLNTPDGLTFCPALLQLYGGLAACFNKSRELLDIARDPARWAARGDAAAKSNKAALPGGKFFAKITATVEETEGGNDFNKGSSIVQPTAEADVERFNKWFSVPAVQKQVVGLVKINNERIAEAKAKVGVKVEAKK